MAVLIYVVVSSVHGGLGSCCTFDIRLARSAKEVCNLILNDMVPVVMVLACP